MDSLLQHYWQALHALQQDAVKFAQQNPTVATQLAISPQHCDDPSIRHLLEGFAFLSARLHQKLDTEFSDISQLLIRQLAPTLLQPMPASCIIQCQPSETLSDAQIVAKNTPLLLDYNNQIIKLQTQDQINLHPIGITDINYHNQKSKLTITLQRLHDQFEFTLLSEKKLRFFINFEREMGLLLYQLLFHAIDHVTVNTHPTSPPLAVGFSNNHDHQLWHQFFQRIENLLFFEILIPAILPEQNSDTLTITVHFNQSHAILAQAIDQHSLLLYCTPAVNCWEQASEPLNINHQQSEYLLLPANPQQQKLAIIDIFSLSLINQRRETLQFSALFDQHYGQQQRNYWQFTRKSADYLSLIPDNPDTFTDQNWTGHANLLCCNYDVPAIPPGHALTVDNQALFGITNITTVTAMRGYYQPFISAPQHNHLLTTLSPTHITMDRLNLATLHQSLALYADKYRQDLTTYLDYFTELRVSPLTLRHPSSLYTECCPGYCVNLTVPATISLPPILYLFGALLAQYLQQYISHYHGLQLQISTSNGDILASWFIAPLTAL